MICRRIWISRAAHGVSKSPLISFWRNRDGSVDTDLYRPLPRFAAVASAKHTHQPTPEGCKAELILAQSSRGLTISTIKASTRPTATLYRHGPQLHKLRASTLGKLHCLFSWFRHDNADRRTDASITQCVTMCAQCIHLRQHFIQLAPDKYTHALYAQVREKGTSRPCYYPSPSSPRHQSRLLPYELYLLQIIAWQAPEPVIFNITGVHNFTYREAPF